MSVTLVARKDFEDVVRSRMLWAILGLFLAFMVIVTAGATSGELADSGAEDVIALFVNVGAGLFIPIVAIFVGYRSIAGERESGSLRVLFGLSHGRSDVMAGKTISRLAAILLATLVACAVVVALALTIFGSVPLGTFGGFVGLTLLLAMMFTAVAVGVSATAATRYRAMGGAIGGYLAFVMFWYPAGAGLHYLIEGDLPGRVVPEWYLLLQYLNPAEAYRQAIMLLLERDTYLLIGWSNIVEDIEITPTGGGDVLVATNRIAGELPWYLSEYAAVASLLAWIVCPLAVGYWQFRRADLN